MEKVSFSLQGPIGVIDKMQIFLLNAVSKFEKYLTSVQGWVISFLKEVSAEKDK